MLILVSTKHGMPYLFPALLLVTCSHTLEAHEDSLNMPKEPKKKSSQMSVQIWNSCPHRMRRNTIPYIISVQNSTTTREKAFNQLYQHSLLNNVVVSGLRLPFKNESLLSVVEDFGYMLGLKNPMKDVRTAWYLRVPQKRKKLIVIRLIDKGTRCKWVQHYRQNELWNEMIYMHEQLTKPNHNLLLHVKKLAKQYSWRYVWIRDGSVLMRENDVSPIYKVNSMEHVHSIMKLYGET
uniref:FP protein C-terminal domain-containing protein n=1 Tax=Cacopsylla melanoneura TaxID=428564 RepID=A0A8D8QQ40_9HEMI